MARDKVKVKKKSNRPTVAEYLRERFTNIPTTIFMVSYILFCFATLIYILVTGQFEKTGNCLAFLAMGFLFYIAEYALNVRSPYGFTAFLWLFLIFNFMGACYNLYALISFIDDILHAAWGIAFAVIGIIIIKSLMGVPKTKKAVVCYVLFGVGFVMLTSVVWEIYEYFLDHVYHTMDMQPSTLITHFHSFFAHEPYDGYHTGCIDGITKTVIHYIDNGQPAEFTIEGGYIDMGINDTMIDLIDCFSSMVIFSIVLGIDWCRKKWLYRFIIPALVGEKYDKQGNLLTKEDLTAASADEVSAEAAAEVFEDMGATPAEMEQAEATAEEETPEA